MNSPQRIIVGILSLILVVTAVQAFVPKPVREESEDAVMEEECIGDPIVVNIPYTGAVVDPWSCQPQCEDDLPRYLLYSNGKATQCETPPGCNDYGEDHGITCIPQDLATPAQ